MRAGWSSPRRTHRMVAHGQRMPVRLRAGSRTRRRTSGWPRPGDRSWSRSGEGVSRTPGRTSCRRGSRSRRSSRSRCASCRYGSTRLDHARAGRALDVNGALHARVRGRVRTSSRIGGLGDAQERRIRRRQRQQPEAPAAASTVMGSSSGIAARPIEARRGHSRGRRRNQGLFHDEDPHVVCREILRLQIQQAD